MIRRRKMLRKDVYLQIRLTEEQKATLDRAARAEGLALSSWMRVIGLRAAKADERMMA
jgi:uncharacterized protein (DUF1778 family)